MLSCSVNYYFPLFIEAGARQAKTEHDDQWPWFLYVVCERLHIERQDFLEGAVFDAMEEIYSHDA